MTDALHIRSGEAERGHAPIEQIGGVRSPGGKILEVGTPSRVFAAPTHQRTREFLAKVL